MKRLPEGPSLSNPLEKTRGQILKKKLFDQKLLLLMLLPLLLAVFIFRYLPMTGWVMAFKDYQIGQNMWDADWAGLEYFQEFFSSTGDALYVIENTLVINILSIAGNMILSCITAVLLNELVFKKYKTLVQTASFFPFFVSWVIAYTLFSAFFSVNTGVVNTALVQSGLLDEGINLMGDAKYSWPLMIIVNIWRSLGYNTVIFLSAITSIDTAQYEAAEIDGAGRLAKIRYITLPGVASTFLVLLIINSGWIFNSNFEQFYLFTNITNRPTMEVFDMYIYRYGLELLDFSYATAVGVVKTAVSIILLILVNAASKRFAGKSVF